MNYFGHDGGFWTAVTGAALIRLLTAEYEGPVWARAFRGFATAFSAIFAAVVFTEPLLDITGFPSDTYKIPFAALVALTGEGVMRMLMNVTWANVFDALKAWRGGK